MQQRWLIPDVITYSTAISSCEKGLEGMEGRGDLEGGGICRGWWRGDLVNDVCRWGEKLAGGWGEKWREKWRENCVKIV